MKVYFISGLAADSRVFCHIELPPFCEAVHLQWIKPLQNETLGDYAGRLAEGINTKDPFAIVGLSMGGMMAAEISLKHKPVATILISSIPSSSHLPKYYRLAATLRLHRMLPISLVKKAAKVKRLFTRESEADKRLLRQIIEESDNNFIRWAMNAIVNWRQLAVPQSYIHIHGTSDEMLPARYTKPTHLIKKGSHLLVITRSGEVNEILKTALE